MAKRSLPWRLRLRYEVWAELVYAYFGSRFEWTYQRICALPDQYAEDMLDAVGTYCMGGEL